MDTDLHRRIHACWLGKAIGGTLGAPHEGAPEPLNLKFYDPVPEGILPNDDLDLQLVWLHHLRATGARAVTPEIMADAWRRHVRFPFDEYGVCLRNLELGLSGRDSGAYDNWFGECMGAAIRSEIWACVAPGEPERAAGFAWADAVCDHSGEGVWAEVFFAALQSAAFIENDPDILLDRALGLLAPDSLVARAIRDTRRWWGETGDYLQVRARIVEAYGGENFTDVKPNLAFTILGWLAGGGDFGRSICIATNCGLDTDCTAATLGALLGILDPDGIPEEWVKPIGEEVVVSPPIIGINPPATLRELTDWTLALREQLAADRPVVGVVRPRQPVSKGASLASIAGRVQTPCSVDETAFGESSAWTEQVLAGNWTEITGGNGSGWALALAPELVEAQDCVIMAYAPQRTRVWLDGRELECAAADFTSYGRCAPSPHRGGRVVFHAGMMTDGPHDLRIWVDLSEGESSELVVALADSKTRLWLVPNWLESSASLVA